MSLQPIPQYHPYINQAKKMIQLNGVVNTGDIEYNGPYLSLLSSYGPHNMNDVVGELDTRLRNLETKINGLENECSRLSTENLELRNQLDRLPQAQLEI